MVQKPSRLAYPFSPADDHSSQPSPFDLAVAPREHHSESAGFLQSKLQTMYEKSASARSPDLIRQLSLKLHSWKTSEIHLVVDPRSLNRDRPHSRVIRCSPIAAIFTGDGGSSRAISDSFFAGIVTAPASLDISCDFSTHSDIQIVPESLIPLSVVSTRIFARTGRLSWQEYSLLQPLSLPEASHGRL